MTNQKIKEEKLNGLLADYLSIYVKLHGLHWKVKGFHFKEIHEMTEVIYDRFTAKYDEIAERMLQLGMQPIASLEETMKLKTIEELKQQSFAGKEVIQIIVKDFEHMNKNVKNAISQFAEDELTLSILGEEVGYYEKQLWMLKATLES